MKSLILFLFTFVLLFLNTADVVSADYNVAGESASLRVKQEDSADLRAVILRKYLTKHNSPLADYAEEFIATADKYNLDWRLLPAISGVESTFGKRIPYKSYNAYGWAGGLYRFSSWEDSIEVVSKSLKEDYVEKGADSFSKMARRYCPPNPAWGYKVLYFMKQIEPLPLTFTLEG